MGSATEDKCSCSISLSDVSWVERAIQQAEVHMKLLTSVGPSKMKFSPLDDELYRSFRKQFPDFDVMNIQEDALRNKDDIKRWKNWRNQYKDTLKDCKACSLVRIDPTQDYSGSNKMFCFRAQFLAIEIARNREGYNQKIVDDCKNHFICPCCRQCRSCE